MASAALTKRLSMTRKYTEISQHTMQYVAKLRNEIPSTMNGFAALAQASTEDGALDKKTKELIALAIAVAAGCCGCIAFHAQILVRLNATRKELLETLGMSIYMGGGPAVMYAAEALKAYEEFSHNNEVA